MSAGRPPISHSRTRLSSCKYSVPLIHDQDERSRSLPPHISDQVRPHKRIAERKKLRLHCRPSQSRDVFIPRRTSPPLPRPLPRQKVRPTSSGAQKWPYAPPPRLSTVIPPAIHLRPRSSAIVVAREDTPVHPRSPVPCETRPPPPPRGRAQIACTPGFRCYSRSRRWGSHPPYPR